jgi:hypothetical protein
LARRSLWPILARGCTMDFRDGDWRFFVVMVGFVLARPGHLGPYSRHQSRGWPADSRDKPTDKPGDFGPAMTTSAA